MSCQTSLQTNICAPAYTVKRSMTLMVSCLSDYHHLSLYFEFNSICGGNILFWHLDCPQLQGGKVYRILCYEDTERRVEAQL